MGDDEEIREESHENKVATIALILSIFFVSGFCPQELLNGAGRAETAGKLFWESR